jgi:surfactin synthase thioesterase subunit
MQPAGATETAERWLEPLDRPAHPRVRLYCFPFAGGSAASVPWQAEPAQELEAVAVQLPGRAGLIRIDPLETIDEAVAALAPVTERSSLPIALWGHSLGAIIAFELARTLEAHGIAVVHLVVSARPAPHLRRPVRPVSTLSHDRLVELLRRLGATPASVLENEEMLDIVLPAVRADFRLSERYAVRPGPMLRCPVTAIRGAGDRWVPEHALLGWAQYTSGAFEPRTVAGGHFFQLENPTATVRLLREIVVGA